MNKRPFMIMILAVLLAQPIMVAVSTPATMFFGIQETNGTFAVAQGSRLGPGEYTNHVPFTIDGTADFGLQGWPGAGTPGDPYIIAGLNITSNAGFVGIQILNTDASFVIRDCLVDQRSSLAAIKLVNTTAGTIEYTTVHGSPTGSSDSGAIRFLNSNNTVVTHVHSDGNGDMGFYAQFSNHISLTWDLFNATNYRATYVSDSDYLTVDHSSFIQYSTIGYWCTRFLSVNHTTITNSAMYADGGVAGIAIANSYYASINNVYLWGSIQNALQIEGCPNITVTGITIEETDSLGVYVDYSPGFVFTDSSVYDTGSTGVDISDCPNSTLSNIDITMTDNHGLNIVNSGNTSATGIVIDDVSGLGVQVTSSDFMNLDDFTVTNTGDVGIYFGSSDNGSLTDSSVEMSNDAGIALEGCYNWTITDNHVDYIDGYGFYHGGGDNLILTRNYINYCYDDGIYIDTADNIDIVDNHVTMSDNTGISVQTTENATIAGNTVDKSDDGCYVVDGLNVVIEGNSFTNLLDTGMYISSLEDATIRNNIVSGEGEIGMNIDYLMTSIIEDNQLTGFGFWFQPTRAYSYYNNTILSNTVDGKDLYYALNQVGVDITASDYGQVIVINGSHYDVHDGSFDHVTNPIMCILSDNISVWDVTIMNNYYAIYYDRTDDGVIHDVSIDGGHGYGIAVRLSDEFNIANSTISGCDETSRTALVFSSSDGAIVTDCEFDNNYYGIWINDVNDGLFTDNLITNSQSYAVSVWNAGSYYLRILNNEMYYDTYGIYLEQADNVSISMNTIMYASIWGIFVGGSSSSYVNVTLNDVSNNENGITMRNNGNSYVMNNTVMFNDGYGIYNDPFTAVEVYYNTIAFNLGDNGLDEIGGNYWDNGVDTGNWWSDYTPPGVYAVDGNTDDRYPMPFAPTEPIINQPPDVFYAEGDEGNEITWYVYDDSLRDWAVTIDGGAWEADAWNFVDITVNVDGLAYGDHTVVVTVWDIHDNSATDTVIVHV
ncbi:MAG: right-handed parallel beta-helix repeat-containing protein, partial [Candidatus Thorarchaeota archaeon]